MVGISASKAFLCHLPQQPSEAQVSLHRHQTINVLLLIHIKLDIIQHILLILLKWPFLRLYFFHVQAKTIDSRDALI